jgi:hypothetical protein
MEGATDAKSAVEGAQRDLRRAREEKGESFTPRFFVSQDGRWVPKIGSVNVLSTSAPTSPCTQQRFAGRYSGGNQTDRELHLAGPIMIDNAWRMVARSLLHDPLLSMQQSVSVYWYIMRWL